MKKSELIEMLEGLSGNPDLEIEIHFGLSKSQPFVAYAGQIEIQEQLSDKIVMIQIDGGDTIHCGDDRKLILE